MFIVFTVFNCLPLVQLIGKSCIMLLFHANDEVSRTPPHTKFGCPLTLPLETIHDRPSNLPSDETLDGPRSFRHETCWPAYPPFRHDTW